MLPHRPSWLTAICYTQKGKDWRITLAKSFAILLLAMPVCLRAQDQEDLDAHTLRFDGFWFYSKPTGSLHGTGSQGLVDVQRDLHFNSYSTGSGRVEWKFTRKNHLYFAVLPLDQSKKVVLGRNILFHGQTFQAGLVATGRLQLDSFVVGYQYDIFRRKQWHLGFATQLDLFYIRGSLQAAAQTLNGTRHSFEASSDTLRAPLPVLGPEFRAYLIPNSNRLFVGGNLLGMYFFGYGNFISSYGTLGLSLNKHLNLQGGYQLGSRFDIKSDLRSGRIGVNLSQKGAVAGLEVSF